MMWHRIMLCLMLFCCFVSQAQQPYYVQFSVEKGFPSNTVYQIFEDKQGFVWIAHDEGLCRFDGSEYKEYKGDTLTSAAGSNIQQDKFGRIWYQNFDGYCYYVENDSLYKLAQSHASTYLPFGITSEHVFIVTKSGVNVYSIKSLMFIKHIPIHFINPNSSASDGVNYYIIDNKDVYCINERLEMIRYSAVIPPTCAVVSLFYRNQKLYVVPKYNETQCIYEWTGSQLLKPVFRNSASVIQGLYIHNNHAWILTPDGIYQVNEQGGVQQFIKGKNVSDVMRDSQKQFWITTIGDGILLMPNLDNAYTELWPEKPTHIIRSYKSFWIFTQAAQLIQYPLTKSAGQSKHTLADKSPVYYAYCDTIDGYACASSKRFTAYELQSMKPVFSLTLAIKEIVKLDKSYYAYAASGSVGLLKIKQSEPSYSIWDDVYGNKKQGFKILIDQVRARSIVYDSISRSIYTATNIGLWSYSKGVSTEVLINNARFYATKLFLYKNTLFALTASGQLFSINDQHVSTLINSNTSKLISQIKMAKQFEDLLLIAGEDRLVLIQLNNPNRIQREYDLGIHTSDITDFLINGEKLIVLTHKGVIETSLLNQPKQRPIPQLRIHQLLINNQPYEINTIHHVSYNQNKIQIRFSILDFINQSLHQVEYSYDGVSWNQIPKDVRAINFASLSPGSYQIYFRIDGYRISDIVQFVISKPFWQTTWFILLEILIVVGIFYIIYKRQMNRVVQKNKLLTERYELENELNKSILVSIRSQMNPHFFYNALNTIQSYIFNNDKKNASNYLSKFSKLTRTILEMSEKERIKLSEEINSLQLYLDLEKMRFEDELHYEILVHKSIDTDLIKIPPMLIQPYVENAIKHGLLHLKGKRILQISFDKVNGNQLTVTIDDNGIGRKKSGELNKLRTDKYESFSTNANAKRLQILNRGQAKAVAVKVIDKYDTMNHPSGTSVIIHIPYN